MPCKPTASPKAGRPPCGERYSGPGLNAYVRYLGTCGSDRVRRAAIISGIPPCLLKTDGTPRGVPQEIFGQIAGALIAGRFAYFTEWNKDFFNLDETLGSRISEEVVRDAWNTAVSASPKARSSCG